MAKAAGQKKTKLSGKDYFDAGVFKDPETLEIFHKFIAKMHVMCGEAKPTATHEFFKTLDEKKKLVRVYTQNIDCLEKRLDLYTNIEDKKTRVVQLHGTLDQVYCVVCTKSFEFTAQHLEHFEEGEAPPCPSCKEYNDARIATGRRSVTVGRLRPDIVLYNENHIKGDIISKHIGQDLRRKPDLLIVMGTSMKIPGLKALVHQVADVVHENEKGRVLFINKTDILTSEWQDVFDFQLIGEADKIINALSTDMEVISKKKRSTTPKTPRSTRKTIAVAKKIDVYFPVQKKSPLPCKNKKGAEVSIADGKLGTKKLLDESLATKKLKGKILKEINNLAVSKSISDTTTQTASKIKSIAKRKSGPTRVVQKNCSTEKRTIPIA